MHLLVVWAAIYLTWGLGIRPDWRSYRIAFAVTLSWMVGVFGVNTLLGSNYGYVNAKPAAASLLDYFGPWPMYLVVEVAIVSALWALMTWPLVRRSQRSGAATDRRPPGAAVRSRAGGSRGAPP